MTPTKAAEDVLVEQIRDLQKRATVGPWIVHPVITRVDCQKISEKGGLLPVAQLLWPTDERSEDETEANVQLIALVPQMADAITTLIERVAELEKQRLMILVAVYGVAPKFVATICDEKLDRSGALLGEVRALARAALTREGE